MRKKVFSILVLLLLGSAFLVFPVSADEITLAQTVQASQAASYSVELHNDTSNAHDYALTVTGLPDSLAISFSQGGPRLDTVTVAANGFEQVAIQIEVPAETPVGHYTAQFNVVRDDGQELVYPLSLTVENTYSLKIISQSLNLTTFSGQEFTFDVTATNTGAAPITNIKLMVDAPPKWIVSTDPTQLPSLEPGSETTIHARVLVPASQTASDQNLSLVLTSDQADSQAGSLTVRVQKSPTFFYVAMGVVALAVGGVFLYFRSKGRR